MGALNDTTYVSIHAPVRERQEPTEIITPVDVSIHAPVRERHNYASFYLPVQVSIHAPVRERRYVDRSPRGHCFNSRSREGAT